MINGASCKACVFFQDEFEGEGLRGPSKPVDMTMMDWEQSLAQINTTVRERRELGVDAIVLPTTFSDFMVELVQH
jgi:hypothetical protein